ncbi:MAG: helix-turn-helix transcriptional regulator [Ruminococcaceae bacterium]|nr:helix-turn-helix transcriptional regulator [Oscillospiraceae bacterium]
MNSINFFKNFTFNKYNFFKYRFTDNFVFPGCTTHYIGIMLKGHARLNTHYYSIDVKEGDVFYIPKNLLYQSRWYGDENNEIEFFSLGFKIFPKEENMEYMLQKLSITEDEYKLLMKITENLNEDCMNIGLLYTFIGSVSKNMKINSSEKQDENIRKAISFMHQNPNATVNDIAHYCNMSESGIYAMFKRVLNKTPVEIKHKILIDKACELLATTDKSIEEISDILGFSSASYFRKVMKSQLGKTPREIRKNSDF